MKEPRTKWYPYCLSLGWALVSACAAKPEDGTSGRCALNCSSARVGAAEFQLEPLSPPESILCTADFVGQKSLVLPMGYPIQIRYKIYELVPAFGQSSDPNAAAAGGAAAGGAGATTPTTTTASPLLTQEPRGGIGFEPFVYGNVSVKNTASEFQIGNGQISPAKYAGIVTPPSEWCSDSCGMITYEVWPNCALAQSNAIAAGVAAGGATIVGQNPVQITITNGQTAN